MKYDYDPTDRRILLADEKGVRGIHLLLEDSLEVMGRMDLLKGQALKDYQVIKSEKMA
jgi:hypothetical protein